MTKQKSVFASIFVLGLLAGNLQEGISQCPDYIQCTSESTILPPFQVPTPGILYFGYNSNQSESVSSWTGQNIEIHFGLNSPLNSDEWRMVRILNLGTTDIFFENEGNVIPCQIYPHVTLTTPTGETCVYENNILCPGCEAPSETNPACEEWVKACEEDLVNIITTSGSTQASCIEWKGGCGVQPYIYRIADVGIGIDEAPPSNSDFKLYVRGGILTEQLKIVASTSSDDWGNLGKGEDIQTWCDYVFEEGYPLLPLSEVEQYIGEHGHLPKTPSAAAVKEEGGYMLRETILNHQEKIEEVFLHLIDLDKQLDSMKESLAKK